MTRRFKNGPKYTPDRDINRVGSHLNVTAVELYPPTARDEYMVVARANVIISGVLELRGFKIWERVPGSGRLTVHPPDPGRGMPHFGFITADAESGLALQILLAYKKAVAEGKFK